MTHLTVTPGEIHAVLGENGAVKSTLMKIVYGAVQPDAGTLRWNGELVAIKSPAQARALGISMVYQHFSLFDTLSVAEHVWLGLDKTLGLAEVTRRITELAASYGLEVEPQRTVHTLSVGERQHVEIVRALLTKPQLLILDEPTSVLTPQAVDKLFVTPRRLAEQGCIILYISQKLDEIRAPCQRCTVLRGGRVTRRGGSARRKQRQPVAPDDRRRAACAAGARPRTAATVLAVRGLSLPRLNPFGTDLKNIHLQVRAGEVLGIAGVSGNGQQELMAALYGEDTRAAPGSIALSGGDIARAGPRERRRAGLNFVPEERLGRGAVPSVSLAQNTLLTRTKAVSRRGWVHTGRVQRLAEELIARFGVRAGGAGAAAKSLSGGNLQKFIFRREISAQPKLLIVSQPTWGVDVGAAAQIRGELLALREAGCALLVVGEELDEL